MAGGLFFKDLANEHLDRQIGDCGIGPERLEPKAEPSRTAENYSEPSNTTGEPTDNAGNAACKSTDAKRTETNV
eukprot:11182012-Lingulodinium_polyedra.AAC.1